LLPYKNTKLRRRRRRGKEALGGNIYTVRANSGDYAKPAAGAVPQHRHMKYNSRKLEIKKNLKYTITLII